MYVYILYIYIYINLQPSVSYRSSLFAPNGATSA